MDATEVSNAQYAQFLAASPATSGQLPECAWNTSYVPALSWPATGKDEYPVVYVDWCDAYAYCKWAQKRLCGKIGGGTNAYDEHALATRSQWYNACSAGGTKTYPYGSTYSGTACNGDENGVGATLPAGSKLTCEGGYPGLFDLSGNVREWEDSCSGATCRLRGGSFEYGTTYLACGLSNYDDRDDNSGYVGFRCCSG